MIKSVGSKGEFTRIKRIQDVIGRHSPRVLVGIGDDAAVVRAPSAPLLLCTDAMAEGVHFDLSWATPEDLGHKSLASCLSDIAAMNGKPLYALFSLACPKSIDTAWLESFYRGAVSLANDCEVDIVGGDLTGSKGGVFIDVVCVGEAERSSARAGAKPGDVIAVSGTPGASAAGLYALQHIGRKNAPPNLVEKHLRPKPRFDLLLDLNDNPGSFRAMIDVSDGLASELHHLAENSGVGIEIDEAKIPLHPDAVALAERSGVSALDWALGGGEDYELLVSFADGAPIPEGFTVIGRVMPEVEGLSLVEPNGQRKVLAPRGFSHF